MHPTRFSFPSLTLLPIRTFYASLRGTKPVDAFAKDEVQEDVEESGMQARGSSKVNVLTVIDALLVVVHSCLTCQSFQVEGNY